MNKLALAAATAAATACLLAANTASAQSAVTVYGRLDAGITKQNGGTTSLNGGNGATGAAGDRWDVRQGSSSRLGFRGREDLGDGLYAAFNLEHRFQSDTGASNTPFWEGRSTVELGRKEWGSVYLGREYVPLYTPGEELDPFRGDTVAQFRNKFAFADYAVGPAAAGTAEGVRTNNTVGYKSPNWAGFTAQLAVAAGEGVRKRDSGGSVAYSQGPVYAAVAFDRLDGDNNVWLIGGAYDLGVVRPMLSYARSEVAAVKTTNVLIGATAPLGAGRLKAGYGQLEKDGDNNDYTKWGVGYEYPFSKRTSVYTDIASARRQGLTRTTGYDFGIKHNF